jgi:hypothetical protein
MASLVPEASQVLTITPVKDHFVFQLKEQLNLPATTIKVKEFIKKISNLSGVESEMGLWVFWESETTDIAGVDLAGKKFALMIRCKYHSLDGPDIWTRLDWQKEEKDEKKQEVKL